jgi:2-polyprenyl-6-hydroxyphenyl methylase/3-demethylubiquinone-9 3-methyltransferase
MSTANADASEVGRFDALAHRFWDPAGEFKPLHILNPVRARFVAERAKLRGARVLDVGCGGGLLCEALARESASVTGIDLAPGMIEVARLHALEQNLAIDYRAEDVELLAAAQAGSFDVVTCMEMLEHVPDPARMVATLARLVKPGGHLFVSTINRNLRSFLMAIVAAEYRAAHTSTSGSSSRQSSHAGRARPGSRCAKSPGWISIPSAIAARSRRIPT